MEDDAVWRPDAAHHRFTPEWPAAETPPTVLAPPPIEQPDAPRRRSIPVIAVALALALIAGVGGAGVAALRRPDAPRPALAAQPALTPNPTPSTTPTLPAPSTTDNPTARRGVVEISTTLAFGSGRGAGTGMLLSPSGEVLTNNHVIEGTSSISVQINGTGRAYDATVIGTDAAHDIALLRLDDASGLTPVQTAKSTTLKLGDPVTAIGNALGQAGPPTVATGSVTALNQSITAGDRGGEGEALSGLIQTDIPLQPGDSGGPLLNSNSQVVGINTAASIGRRALRGGNEAYAIPIETALAIADDIRAGRGSATIQIGPPAFLGVGLEATPARGAGVGGVEDGYAGEGAGHHRREHDRELQRQAGHRPPPRCARCSMHTSPVTRCHRVARQRRPTSHRVGHVGRRPASLAPCRCSVPKASTCRCSVPTFRDLTPTPLISRSDAYSIVGPHLDGSRVGEDDDRGAPYPRLHAKIRELLARVRRLPIW